ncbi:YdcF family protein [Pullulanibacillus sp. KACC 23026]|uniref:YdcF family protein n=1 Tax=Pullulanibacillus sp. KACC 23026 TaxID=3028315 RepID=UPI0023B13EDE|nr:YdcF family protein [Pullulanibacillus sp. KACC 23026]WEG14549.1 YdcF family protein [Pullulanibacillus sp. KACC 23026]
MYISQLSEADLTDERMADLLFKGIEDDQKSGDCIFVVGSSKALQYRLPKAVELYQQGRAGKLLFSGGMRWEEGGLPEALTLKNEAIALGVPETDILIEDGSLNTLENVVASLLVLDRAFHLYAIKRLLVVTTSYHMRRLHLTLKTYMPKWIEFTLCQANDTNTNKNNWFLTEKGRRRVRTECLKLIKYVKQGALVDLDLGDL